MPYPLSSSKGYGGGSSSTGLGYSSIPSTSYMPGLSSMLFNSHSFSSGRSPLYSGSSAGSSLGLLGLSSYSMPSYGHVSPYASASSSYGSYGGYSSSSAPKSYYSPLPTISEHSSGGASSSANKRRIPRTYIPVLPLPSAAGNRPALYSSSGVKTLFTEDIDVTTPRKTAKPADISRQRSGEGYGTIRRGRTVIRLETKKLKENPYLPTEDGEQKEKEIEVEPKVKETENIEEPVVTPPVNEEVIAEKDSAKDSTIDIPTLDDASQLSKDYSQVAKWYEEEIRKPMKKERNAGDKFREKYMVHSRKNKYTGYRRPTLSDIRAQKAVVMKEIEERLKKLADTTPSGTEAPEELKAEAQKLEKDKERLARLDKKMAKRFSRALKKAEHVPKRDGDTSDDESICADRQATVKGGRKLSSGSMKITDLPLACDGEEDAEGIQNQRLTRKITKRFFFPQEATSVVQPEIIETPVPEEPEDQFEKNILAQRQTVKMRSTQKKVAHINQRKSSASDLEIPAGNLLSDKLCDVEAKTALLEPPEEFSEPSKPLPSSAPGSANASGKKKKFVKKVGDPPAKRVPGNILQPLVVPPKDSDSILESPTEEEIESAKLAKKKSVEKVNGLVGKGLKSPFLKNNFIAKPLIPNNNKWNKQEANKLTNVTPAGGVGTLPGKKAGEWKPSNGKLGSSDSQNTTSGNVGPTTKPVAEIKPKAAAVTPVLKVEADEKKEMSDLTQTVPPPTSTNTKSDTANDAGKVEVAKTSPQMKNDKAEDIKSENKLEGEKKLASNNEEATNKGLQGAKDKPLPVVAKLKPRLALDNKSSSLDGLKPKHKLDGKSASFDANDDKNNAGTDKTAAAPTKKPLTQQDVKQETVEVVPPTAKPVDNQKAKEPEIKINKTDSNKENVKENVTEKTKEPVVDTKLPVIKLKKQENNESTVPFTKEVTPVPKKEVTNADKKENITTKEETLKPIKKIDAPENKAPTEAKRQLGKSPAENNIKKVSPVADNESLAKQDLTPVKVEEKKLETPKKADAKKNETVDTKPSNAKHENKSDVISEIASKSEQIKPKEESAAAPKDGPAPKKEEPAIPPKEKPEIKTQEQATPSTEKSELKSPPVSPKTKSPEEKQKPGVKSPQQKVPPLELKEKLGIKSPPPSPKLKTPCKKPEASSEPLTSALASSDQKSKDDNQQISNKPINDAKSPEKKETDTKAATDGKSQSPVVNSLPNGHLSPPASQQPKSGGAILKPTTGKPQAQKSPQPNETTQKEDASNDVPSAKVGNLGCSTEMATNGPEKKKSDSTATTDLPDIPTQMNKLGNLSTAATTASENLVKTPPTAIEANSGQKSNSSTTNTVCTAVNESSTSSVTSVDSGIGLEGGDETIDTLPNPVLQSLIRKSLKRGSPRHSSGSSISSSGSSTAKSESGSSTSSTVSAGSSAGSRRAPSPPIEDDSDEDRITICPAKTRPKYRKYEIDDFQFLKVLGKGSFGKVLLAELKSTDSYFAIKCLKKDVVLEDDDVECTMIERKVLLMGSKHPYLCHLFCTFQTESHLFFVMEYLNGGDLMFHIQQSGRFAEERARFYGAEIVSGLKFLHKRGVIYRDLKLDNILLDYEGHIRIADFGMCKLQIYLDRMADTFCGTPDYMAPEIIRGLRYNQCVDWWAFGVLVYEMLIGQSPFSGHDEDELFWSVCNEPVHYPRFLSKESKRLLELLLEKDASKRLGTVGCIHGDVKEQPFFQPIDWERLERRELEPPYKPKLKHSLDVQYFDTTFTKEAARLTPVDKEILRSMDQTQFEGFSYTNPHTTD